jgi:hypothetical protein
MVGSGHTQGKMSHWDEHLSLVPHASTSEVRTTFGPSSSVRSVGNPEVLRQPHLSVVKTEAASTASYSVEDRVASDEKRRAPPSKLVVKREKATSSQNSRMPYLRRDSSAVLRQWFEENQDKRYPSSDVKKLLAERSVRPCVRLNRLQKLHSVTTFLARLPSIACSDAQQMPLISYRFHRMQGATPVQIRNWFLNARRRQARERNQASDASMAPLHDAEDSDPKCPVPVAHEPPSEPP